MPANIEILPTPAELAQRSAQLIATESRAAVLKQGVFSIALSGGSTPKRLYELLASRNHEFHDQLPWDRMHFFWTDERHVGPDHPDSNYRMANEALLAQVPVPASNVHRIHGERPVARDAALEYESQVIDFFSLAATQLPRFDLVLLGMGTDGHIASIFPDSDALMEKEHLVTAPWVEKLKSYRITLTLPVLNNASAVVFLISGEEKATTLREVLRGPDKIFPAQAIKPTHGKLTWLVDSPAACKLQAGTPDVPAGQRST